MNLFSALMIYMFIDCIRVRFNKQSLFLQQTEEEAENWCPLAMSSSGDDHGHEVLATSFS